MAVATPTGREFKTCPSISTWPPRQIPPTPAPADFLGSLSQSLRTQRSEAPGLATRLGTKFPAAFYECDLDVRQPAVHEDFLSTDVRRLLRRQEQHGVSDLLRLSKPLHGHVTNDFLGELVNLLLRQSSPPEDRSLDRPRAHHIDPNAAPHQFRRQRPRKGTHGSLRSCINRGVPCALLPRDRGIQDDRSAILHQRQRLLDREIKPLHVDVELLVKKRLRALLGWGKLRHTRVGEQHVHLAKLLLHCREQRINVAQLRHISANCKSALADRLGGLVQSFLIAPRDRHLRALGVKKLRRSQSDSAVSASHYCDFPCQ